MFTRNAWLICVNIIFSFITDLAEFFEMILIQCSILDLGHLLQCELLSRLLVLDTPHLAKATFPDDLHKVKHVLVQAL